MGRKSLLTELRRGGRIPSVLYGHRLKSVPISVDYRELTRIIRQTGLNALLEMEISGTSDKKPMVVMVKEMQTDVIHHEIIHLDFIKVEMLEKITVSIPVRLQGKSAGVVEKGGLVEQSRREIEVKCLPGNIPDGIDVDISSLDIGHSIHIKDLKLPEGVEPVQDPTVTVVAIVAPKEEEASAAAPAEGEAAPAEGAAAAAPAEGEKKGEARPEEKKEAAKEPKKESKKEPKKE